MTQAEITSQNAVACRDGFEICKPGSLLSRVHDREAPGVTVPYGVNCCNSFACSEA